MDNTNYIALSQAMVMRRNLDLTANNIANAETSGFKSEQLVFDEYLHRQGQGARDISFVIDTASYMNTNQGGMTPTGGDLDIALQGTGWLAYQTPEGRTTFGRDGRLLIDNLGNLTTYSGAQVLDDGGTPIAIPIEAGRVSISEDGMISDQGGNQIANIGVFEAPDIQGFERLGGGMLSPKEADGEPQLIQSERTRVVQGFLEQSNVEPIVELTRMMEIQRAYDRAIKTGKAIDDLRKDTLSKLGRT